jgi:hypothetical protein
MTSYGRIRAIKGFKYRFVTIKVNNKTEEVRNAAFLVFLKHIRKRSRTIHKIPLSPRCVINLTTGVRNSFRIFSCIHNSMAESVRKIKSIFFFLSGKSEKRQIHNRGSVF